jgi:hypothetical protein
MKMSAEKHDHTEYTEGACYGSAVTTCWEDEDGIMWVGNGEYANKVNFCPFCGHESAVKIENFAK